MKKIIVFGILSIALTSCFKDSGLDIILDKTYVEIDEATTVSGLAITKIYTRTLNGTGVKDSLRVNLVGAQRDVAVNVTFSIDAASTAVAGTDYTLTTTGGIVTIPAKSSYGYIKFLVLDDNIAPSTVTKNLKVILGGGDNVQVSTNYGTFTRRIRTQ
jgi:hypothetical protein